MAADTDLMPFRWSSAQINELRRGLWESRREAISRGYSWDVADALEAVTLFVQANPPERRPQGE